MAKRHDIARTLPVIEPNQRLTSAQPVTATSGSSPSATEKKRRRMAGREIRSRVSREKLNAFSTGNVIEAALTNAPKTRTSTRAAKSVLSANRPIEERK